MRYANEGMIGMRFAHSMVVVVLDNDVIQLTSGVVALNKKCDGLCPTNVPAAATSAGCLAMKKK
eukprot:14291257-Ditylum_brightwellii.AAC.1